MHLNFALNHMTVARQGYRDVIELASELGCVGIEFRNDLAGPLFEGDVPEVVAKLTSDAGLRILGLSEVKMFNVWSADKAQEAEALMRIAQAIGAESISLIPRCDGHGCGEVERQSNLRTALTELLPMLDDFNLTGLIEPLGFAHSSLRLKSEAVAAVSEIGGESRFKLVHDTFHHYLAEEEDLFPNATGIVHVSGVEDRSLSKNDIGDEHRVLVGENDILGNVEQVSALVAQGYRGPVSFEVFSPDIHALEAPRPALEASMSHLTQSVAASL